MLVEKILNNNVISSLDEDKREVILVGRGIGWRARVGQAVDETKVEKTFRMETQDSTNQLKRLLLEVTEESVDASVQIISYASERLRKKLNTNVYITLTDHINFAVERVQKGLEFRNMLIWEARKLYPEEYAVGIYALDVIERVMGIRLPGDEAGSIAIHIVNAEYDSSMEKTVRMTNIIQQSLNIIRYTFRIEYDESSLNYQRLVTHLLFFAQRLLEQKMLTGGQDFMYEMMKTHYPKQFRCARQIHHLMETQYGLSVPPEEVTFLCAHIVRVTERPGDAELRRRSPGGEELKDKAGDP